MEIIFCSIIGLVCKLMTPGSICFNRQTVKENTAVLEDITVNISLTEWWNDDLNQYQSYYRNKI